MCPTVLGNELKSIALEHKNFRIWNFHARGDICQDIQVYGVFTVFLKTNNEKVTCLNFQVKLDVSSLEH